MDDETRGKLRGGVKRGTTLVIIDVLRSNKKSGKKINTWNKKALEEKKERGSLLEKLLYF